MFVSISDEKKVEILNDHYKDTCSRMEIYRNRRNRLAFYAGLIIFTTIFMSSVKLRSEEIDILSIVISYLTRSELEDIEKKLESPMSYYIGRLLPVALLMCVAYSYKHYRSALELQFSYLQLLEAELNSLFPNSRIFNRESDFSLKESKDYPMWKGTSYAKFFGGFCLMLSVSYIITSRRDLFDVVVTTFSCLMFLFCFWLFRSRRSIDITLID